jgi:hypothetical protein
MIINKKLKKNDQQLFLNSFGMCHPSDQPCNQPLKSNLIPISVQFLLLSKPWIIVFLKKINSFIMIPFTCNCVDPYFLCHFKIPKDSKNEEKYTKKFSIQLFKIILWNSFPTVSPGGINFSPLA